MTSGVRSVTFWGVIAAVTAFGAAAVTCYRPDSRTDRAIALDSLERALASLNNGDEDSSARLSAYGEGLETTTARLRRAILANAMDTTSIERLALVLWESGQLAGSPDADALTSLMGIASARAPRVPEIQVELGELCCRMGRQEDASSFMAKAVSLSPSLATRAVTAMISAEVLPDDIFRQLPHVPEVLNSLKDEYFKSARATEFATLVEPDLAHFGSKLLPTYGDACLRANDPERLVRGAEAVGRYDDSEDEAERQRQLSRGYSASGRAAEALSAIQRAVQLSPNDPTLRETLGSLLVAAGDPLKAEASFRTALSTISATATFGWLRPRLYADIGLALDAEGKAEAAVDSYRMALQLDPKEAVALGRLRAINTMRPPIGGTRR